MKDILQKLICFFVFKTKGHITKTQLVKYIYLADLYSVKWTGEKLTDLDWYYYKFGPWHEDIDRALFSLEEKEIVQVSSGESNLINMGEALNEIDSLNLPTSLVLMLENIKKEWSSSNTKELLDYVYQTAPMIEVQKSYTAQDKAKLNLHKERELLLKSIDG